MTKVIKGEFKKLEYLKISDGLLTCNTSLEIFHEEFNPMSRMDGDLFTYEVEIFGHTNIPCDLKEDDNLEQHMSHEFYDDMEYNPSNVEFTEWLALKFYNHKTMDHFTKKALWIYWARGDDEVELTDEESSNSDDEDEVVEIFRIDNIIFDFEPPMMIGFMNIIKMYRGYIKTHERMMDWKDEGYCNRGNFPEAYIVGNTHRYQDLECNEGWRRWNNFENTNRDHEEREYEMVHEDEERCELFDDQERPVCMIRRFEMIKYSFGDDEERYQEVYVAQHPGFIDFEKPDHVYKLKKDLYRLKQAPKAWYDRLKAFLIKHEYKIGMVDNTLFTKKKTSNLIIVQIYVDEIIFGTTYQDMCDEFSKIMHDEFEMSMMGELNFFLGLQIKQMKDGIFCNQSKYIKEMLKKFGLEESKLMKTSMSFDTKLTKDEECELVDSTKYRDMIVVYAESDHAGDYVDRKSTSGICTFVGCCMTSWLSKKETALAISTTKSEYVSAKKACQQALWMK
uniref:Retrovirus-related Pol polyprotein from transposon TNT 1-94 n=1 Tax=Tanacetum cinerariifolium TaxID=118510 RepID=A0A6L2J837_TANCI|nr:retrovirus-related Pol polyprotein from transposon TNT 1-94 [Tanacetum cinerariifolium]